MSFPYGIIGNCKTAAIISMDGSIDWCCYPRFDSPSIFAKLLDDENGGFFSISGVGKYRVSQKYYPNTNILATTFQNPKNAFILIDFFPYFKEGDGTQNENRILRIIRVLRGKPKIKVAIDPRFDYARETPILKTEGDFIIAEGKHNKIEIQSSLPVDKILNGDIIELESEAFLQLSMGEEKKVIDLQEAEILFRKTQNYWYEFVRSITWPKFYRNDTIRSALVLKLLTYEPSGAVLAAATTSLPEIEGKERNWDYRYCWLRDSSFTINTFTRIGRFEETVSFMNFLRRTLLSYDHDGTPSLKLQIMYGVEGETELEEFEFTHLKGHKNSKPVRVGNAAYSQKQIDVTGEVIDSIYEYYIYYKYNDTLDNELWNILLHLSDYVIEHWKEKDQGIWETRGIVEHYTFSKLMCWVAMDRFIKIARQFRKDFNLEKYKIARQEIKEDIMKNAWNEEKKAFTIHYGSEYLDASVLLMPYYGFISGKDEKMVSTIKAIEKELVKEGCFVLRYNFPDDFGEQENSFSICSFWYFDALYLSGEKIKAKKMFRKFLNHSNHLKLYSEDINVETKSQVGNFPQAYTHLALIHTAMLLSGKGQRRMVEPVVPESEIIASFDK